MSVFRFQERNVHISPTADIPNEYRPDGYLRTVTQKALHRVEPWQEGDHTIVTVRDLNERFRAIVVSLGEHDVPLWYIHRGHAARHPQPSPFVVVKRPPLISVFTVELVGSPDKPRLVRAYPGEAIPPLPWQNSARDADGGVNACLQYWRTHAYVYKPTLVQSTDDHVPPNWFRRHKPRTR